MAQAVADITDVSDATLAAQGDADAFERLYREHAARVNTLARRMLGGEDADEVTQDVFVRAWQRLGTFGGRSAFGTWLHRLAVNVILSHRKTLAIRRGRLAEDSALDTFASRSAAPELGMDFEAAINALPEGCAAGVRAARHRGVPARGRLCGCWELAPARRNRNCTVRACCYGPVPVSEPAGVLPASFADPRYDAAVVDLERVLAEHRDRLDPSTVRVLEENLAIMDQAIASARAALARDPASAFLSAHLADAMQRELKLLRDASVLVTES